MHRPAKQLHEGSAMLELLNSPDNVVAYRVSGTLEAEDYDRAIGAVESKLSRQSKIGLYADMTDFTDMTPEALKKDLRYAFSKLGEWDRFPRMALVTDKRWLKGLINLVDPLFPQFEARTFTRGHETEAMTWAAEAPAGTPTDTSNLQLRQKPVATTAMLIRKPVAEVFEAFINPEITTKFWFTKSSGRLEPGKQVQWDWEMYGASTKVSTKAIEPNKRIVIEWDGYSGRTTVEWKFAPQKDGTTFVSIVESGWTGEGDELVKYVANSTQGFTWTLAGLKALLEHNIRLNLVADRYPKGIEHNPDLGKH
jgi:uncharacterized protein YndB with AHSA1/START domain